MKLPKYISKIPARIRLRVYRIKQLLFVDRYRYSWVTAFNRYKMLCCCDKLKEKYGPEIFDPDFMSKVVDIKKARRLRGER